MAKYLIIGGAGFIGAHLAKSLALRGERVDILDNFSRGVRDPFLAEIEAMPSVRLLKADMLDVSTPACIGIDYSVIFQFAAIIGVRHVLEWPYDVLHKNVLIQAQALEVARRQKTLERLVFASTSEVYAGSLLHMAMPIPTPETVPLALTDLAQPRTSYMLSKLYGEAMCQQAGVPFTIVRPHNIYGPRMGMSHVIPELLKKAHHASIDGELPVYSVNHRRTFCYIDDAVQLLRLAAESPKCRQATLNIGNQAPEISMGELAELVILAVGKPLTIKPLPETSGSPLRRCPDMASTTERTGYTAHVGLEAGIRATYQWYRPFLDA
jgi:UDP-glucose 4-epimerase